MGPLNKLYSMTHATKMRKVGVAVLIAIMAVCGLVSFISIFNALGL